MSHATTINNYAIHLYCLALWLRRLGAGLEDRTEGSTTWRSVFCLLAPRLLDWSTELVAEDAGPDRADVEAIAGRMARGDFHGAHARGRLKPARRPRYRRRATGAAAPPRPEKSDLVATTLSIQAERITIITQISFCHTLFATCAGGRSNWLGTVNRLATCSSYSLIDSCVHWELYHYHPRCINHFLVKIFVISHFLVLMYFLYHPK